MFTFRVSEKRRLQAEMSENRHRSQITALLHEKVKQMVRKWISRDLRAHEWSWMKGHGQEGRQVCKHPVSTSQVDTEQQRRVAHSPRPFSLPPSDAAPGSESTSFAALPGGKWKRPEEKGFRPTVRLPSSV